MQFLKTSACILIALGLSVFITDAQDPHFSQFFNAPTIINPAATGAFEGTHRISGNYRNQWQSVTVPYRTFSFTSDMKILRKVIKNDRLTAGCILMRDQAGDANFSNINAMINISFRFDFSGNMSHKLYTGVQVGGLQRSIDFEALYFDSQYNGSQFDPGIGQDEYLSTRQIFVPDLGMGFLWKWNPEEKYSFSSGIALAHVNTPDVSFYGSREKLKAKFSWTGSAGIMITKKTTVNPYIHYALQGPVSEMIIGSTINIVKDQDVFNSLSFTPGCFYRIGDALIPYLGIEYHGYHLGLSYDVTVSSLKQAAGYRGGLEISLYTVFNRFLNTLERFPGCPVF